jgi:hypothetical protein
VGRRPAGVSGPVEMFKNLSQKVSRHQRAEGAGG